MRMSLILPVAAALAVVAIGAPGPVGATEIKEAIKLCKQNPNCKMGSGPRGGYNFTVGTNEVFCPEEGPCECLQCSPPKQRIGPFGTIKVPGKVTPRGVLTSSSGGAGSWTSSGSVFAPKLGGAVLKKKPHAQPKQTPTAEPKPGPTAEPKPGPTTPPARPTANVRDHRVTTPKVDGDRSSPGVTTTRYGYEGAVKASGTGPSEKRKPKIIDHRGVDPASRDAADKRRKPKIVDHRGSSTQPKGGAATGSNCGTQGNPRCLAQ